MTGRKHNSAVMFPETFFQFCLIDDFVAPVFLRIVFMLDGHRFGVTVLAIMTATLD